jgi:hypothetical protein
VNIKRQVLPSAPRLPRGCGTPPRRAVDEGKQLGRPKIDPAIEKRIQSQLRTGKGMLAIARDVGVGSGTIQRIAKEIGHPFDERKRSRVGRVRWPGHST